MKIAICDDEQQFVKKLYSYLWQYSDCSVDCFSSPLELLDKFKNGFFYDVVFLDIMMEPMDGLTLAREIRTYDTHVALVFLTAYAQYAPAGYEVRAFRYLLKPITVESVATIMQELRKDFHQNQKLLLKTAECGFLLCTEDIHYLEVNNKDCTVYYKQDALIIQKSLDDLENELPTDIFFRIHRKYVINLAHVREFDESHLTLDCGKTLPISRRRSQNFRSALENYIGGGL